jgi:hypothetical protein
LSGYFAYRQDAGGSERALHKSRPLSNEWTGYHVLCGGRLRVPEDVSGVISPMCGAGVSLGWARYLAGTEPDVYRSSKPGLGWFAEAGLAAVTRGPLIFSLTMRYDDLNLQFVRLGFRGDRTTDAQQSSWCLGVNYRFRNSLRP